MNEKGFTVVELIVSFVIVMTISIGLFTTVDSYRNNQQQELYKKTVNSYMNEILASIQNDNIKGGGIINIEPESVFERTSKCYEYSQGIKIVYRNNEIRYLCIGNGTIKSEKNGILYGDYLFKKPTKFIEFVDDIIFTNEEYTYDELSQKKVNQVWSIEIKAKHTELKETFSINIVSPHEIS